MHQIGKFFLFLLTINYAFAQTGPGGVGNSTNNLIWLEADDISSLSDGDAISNWSDGSGNSNDLSQGTASFQPEYKTSIINGLPVVRFNQSNGRLRRTPFTSPTTAFSAIYVNATSDANDGVLSYASSASNNDFLIFNSSNLSIYRGPNTNSGISSNDGLFHIINVGWRSSDGSTELWKDGSQSYTATHQTGTSITSGGSIALAGEQDAIDGSYDAGQDHLGDFAEVILFNTYLNSAQQIIIANYLAAKYNITISNDYYAHQGTHAQDVAGIGRQDASNTHTSAMSANILRIENPSALDANLEYLFFGHDNGDVTTSWTTTEAPDAGVNIQRLAREWRMDETGDLGTVDFVIDVNNMPALPAGHTMYALMVDGDGDFSNGASVYELVLSSGTEYQVSGVEIADGDYLAIAAVDPAIQHAETASSGFEPSNASISVSLNFIAQTDRSVSYNTADGTALSAQPDYTAVVGGSLTITAGNQSANYTITINNDVAVESSETFTITLSSPTAGIDLGANTTHTYTINDDDNSRKVYFSLASSSGLESVSPVSITIAINNIDGINPTTVDYAVTGGTATGSGTDYTLASGTATILAGANTTNINLLVSSETLFELDETVIITLSNPTNCNLDGTLPLGGTGFLSHTYTITNDDTSPEIDFDVTSASGSESITLINIQVNLDALSGADAGATYTVTGTATGLGTDYTLANGTVSITAGNLSTNLVANITNDPNEELNETIVVTLSAPTNASLGSNTVFTYTILDDDVFGHLGPGGVGNSTNNKLWAKSDDLAVVADGTDITSWADASGNSHDLTQVNTSFTPRYYNSILNSRPVVRFDQSNGRIIHNSFTDFPTDAITSIFVNSNTDSGEGILSYATSSSNNEYLVFNSSNTTIFRGGVNTSTGTAINDGNFRILGNTWQASDGNTRFYSNGTQTFTGTISSGTPIVAGGCLAIAGEQDAVDGGYDAGQSHQGDFAEVVIYNEVLNSARRKIVENYLSAKYNITVANDLYSHDSPGNYEYEVAGIGRDDISNFHQDAQGTALLRINTPSSMNDGDYQLWGHDNGSLSENTTDIPLLVDNRLNRVWRIDETGDMGTVSVHFDVSGFTIGSSSDLVLLIDSDDGLFANASQVALSSFASNIATFDGVDFSTGNWFTIASLSSSNPLPIELIEFKAERKGESVELSWKTATEINNDFFTIERSADTRTWHVLGTVEGAGNSNQLLEYNFIDAFPLRGGTSYYQLKQTDYDGQFSYSEIENVRMLQNKVSQLRFYPNPASNELMIEGSPEQLDQIQLYNALGQSMDHQINIISRQDRKIILDISQLQKGTYLIRTSKEGNVLLIN